VSVRGGATLYIRPRGFDYVDLAIVVIMLLAIIGFLLF
jgi:hypothetical protein